LTIRFYKFLDGLLASLNAVEKELKAKDDPVFLPIKTKGQMVAANLLLSAVVWSYGAVLGREMRRRFEDTFMQFRRKFDLKLTGNLGGSSMGKGAKVSLFEMFFDLERLQWDLVAERLSSRVSEGYQAKNNSIVIPSLEMAQGMLLFDTLLDKRTYSLHIEGKSACQKSTVLKNICHKQRLHFRSIWVPMTAANSIDKTRKVIEQFCKPSEDRFILAPVNDQKPLFVIDDLHLEENTNTRFSEFFKT
jgi:hypothetical protein